MKRDVIIRIAGLQRNISNEPTAVECRGSLQSADGLHYIRYIDHDGLNTLIKLSPGRAVVTRSGKLSSVMEFTEGSCTSCIYPTPYGNFDTDIETKSISLNGDFPEMDITIRYSLTMNDQTVSECELNIRTSPC
ncbi:MAG: DUF1934 domain-containing protein [Lachnospiraceae bacterium]|nr:DUF1934 domain-containing protein [Lachnospiraceae bacterium]